jgi:hypothetical protein
MPVTMTGINRLTRPVSGSAPMAPIAPRTHPEQERQEYLERRELQLLADEPGLQHVLHYGVHQDESDHDEDRPSGAEFEKREKSGRDHREDEPEVGNDVEEERKEGPKGGGIGAEDEQQEEIGDGAEKAGKAVMDTYLRTSEPLP